MLSFYFVTPCSAEQWVFMGKDNDMYMFMDVDIVPIAQVSNNGKIVLVDGMYVMKYKMAFDNTGERGIPITSFIDQKSYMVIGEGKWHYDSEGLDGLFGNAYLIKDYEKIKNRTPFVMKKQFIPKERNLQWPIESNGWQKIYEHSDGSIAWIQTKSAKLSYYDDSELPNVRILVKRLDIVDGIERITFSYEQYDAAKRIKYVFSQWDENGNTIDTNINKEYAVPILSKDASVGTFAFDVFISNRDEIQNRGQFEIDDKTFTLEDGLLSFIK